MMHLIQPLPVLQVNCVSVGQQQADFWLVLTQSNPHMLCQASGDHSHSVCGPAALSVWILLGYLNKNY